MNIDNAIICTKAILRNLNSTLSNTLHFTVNLLYALLLPRHLDKPTVVCIIGVSLSEPHIGKL